MDVAFCCRGAVLEIRGPAPRMLILLKGLNFKRAVLYSGKRAASEKLIIHNSEFWRLISYLL